MFDCQYPRGEGGCIVIRINRHATLDDPWATIEFLGGEAAGRTDPDDPFIQVVVDAARDVYGMPMAVVPMVGGSGPNHVFLEELNLPIATAGVGYPGSKAHAPNENVVIAHYLNGAKHITRILKEFAK